VDICPKEGEMGFPAFREEVYVGVEVERTMLLYELYA
jgi:hypothetical protein